jgi:hypothetical protein
MKKRQKPNQTFVIYEKATGNVVQVIEVPAHEVSQNLEPGQACRFLREGEVIDPDRHRIDQSGAIVDTGGRAPNEDVGWRKVRAERDRRLAQCDWTQALDSPLSVTDRAAWAAYRQELRDITVTFKDAVSVEWPAHPGKGVQQ